MKEYIFTFGFGHAHPNGYHVIEAETYEGARVKMFERFGPKWAFQYGSRKAAGVDEFNLQEIFYKPTKKEKRT